MDTLNHHHLYHFWTVVREGGVTRANEKLHVYGVRLVGRLDTVRQRFYAITVERKVSNPAVIAISERARALFG